MNTNPSKSVQFAGRTLVIQPKAKTFRTALVVDSVRAALLETIKDRQITGIEFYYYYNIYPVLAACTEAADGLPIPSADDTLDNTDEKGAGEWYAAAVEVNPHLFDASQASSESETPEAAEDHLKKKRRRSRRSLQPAA